MTMENEFRMGVERGIAARVVNLALKQGWRCAVASGGEDFDLVASVDKRGILEAMFAVDDCSLVFYAEGEDKYAVGWVRFIYGNSGWDVINDYTANLTTFMEPIDAFTSALDENDTLRNRVAKFIEELEL
jgi:hypothetical protein